MTRPHSTSFERFDPPTVKDGYAKARISTDEMRTEFVCIPRPVTRSDRPDGGPLRYRVVHAAPLWRPGERPRLRQEVLEGDPGLSL